VPLSAAVSHASLGIFVANVATVVDRAARQARVVPAPAALHVVPSRDGLAVRRDALLQALTRALLRYDGARTIAVPTRVVHPRRTTDGLARHYPAFLLVDRETFTLGSTST
jgi:vancomycin resistance protein YoaR